MTEDNGITLEFNTKQAAIISLVIGLVVGGFAGFAAGTMTNSQLAAESADNTEDSPQNSESSGPELVSMEGIEFEGEPSKGNESAPIKIIEYNEFGCPFCAEWQGIDASGRTPIDQMNIAGELESQYIDTGEVEFISKDYPVPQLHPNGPEAHKAANCVYEHEKDSYWEYHDELFERRDRWMASGDGATQETFREISNDLGLDTDTVIQCYQNSSNQEAKEDRTNAVRNLGGFGTPTFFVGNRETGFVKLVGAQPLPRFEEAIQTVRDRDREK